jgi:hypothetical protein
MKKIFHLYIFIFFQKMTFNLNNSHIYIYMIVYKSQSNHIEWSKPREVEIESR